MIRRTLLIALVLVVAFMLSGCAGVKQIQEWLGFGGQVKPFSEKISGDRGLTVTLLNLPYGFEMIEGKEGKQTIIIELFNRGGYDVSGGVLLVTSDDRMMIKNPRRTINIKGRKYNSDIGESQREEFEIEAYPLYKNEQTAYSNIDVMVCYDYKTNLVGENVCIDTDPLMKKSGQVCHAAPLTFWTGQGGPVSVREIKPDLSYEVGQMVRPRFKITIRNNDNGFVVLPEYATSVCSNAVVEGEALNKVRIKAHVSMADELVCDPSTITLKDGEGSTICEFQEPIRSDVNSYVTPITVELSYGYFFRISRDVVITKKVFYD